MARVVWAASSHRPNAICPFFPGLGQAASGVGPVVGAVADDWFVGGREAAPVLFWDPELPEHAASEISPTVSPMPTRDLALTILMTSPFRRAIEFWKDEAVTALHRLAGAGPLILNDPERRSLRSSGWPSLFGS